jgi:hypothetical protein
MLLCGIFCMKNWKQFTLDLSYYKTCLDELIFGYVVLHAMFRLHTKICTKFMSKCFYMIYLVFLMNLHK